MKEYSVIVQLSFSVTAKNEEQAKERAEAAIDSAQFQVPKDARRAWWPEEYSLDDLQVTEN